MLYYSAGEPWVNSFYVLSLPVLADSLLVLECGMGLEEPRQLLKTGKSLVLLCAWIFQGGCPNLVISAAGLPEAQQIG